MESKKNTNIQINPELKFGLSGRDRNGTLKNGRGWKTMLVGKSRRRRSKKSDRGRFNYIVFDLPEYVIVKYKHKCRKHNVDDRKKKTIRPCRSA